MKLFNYNCTMLHIKITKYTFYDVSTLEVVRNPLTSNVYTAKLHYIHKYIIQTSKHYTLYS